jgi:hypothetical protein
VRYLPASIRFACEIAAIVGILWWGWIWEGVVFATVVIVVWGAFVSPKARWRLHDPGRFAVELVIFAFATACWWWLGYHTVAIVFAVCAAATAVLVRRWPEP